MPRFAFCRIRRGALIYGIIAGVMMPMQGLAFAATYTGELARQQFATALASNPVLGLLYGEIRDIESPAGYMVYRTVPFLALIGSIWALAATTRLLRGQEEDGRTELLLAGRFTLPALTWQLLQGMLLGLVVAGGILAAIFTAAGQSPDIQSSVPASLFAAGAVIAAPLLGVGIGALTSQLAATRRQAMALGMYALLGWFVLRSIGNVVPEAGWLKYYTPFGWIDKLHPLTGSDGIWFVPLVGLAVVCTGAAFYFARKRDMLESIIADSPAARPRTTLLGGPVRLGLRLSRGSLLGWAAAVIGVSAMVAGIAKTAAEALAGSPELSKAIATLTSSNGTATVAFFSFSGFFITLLLTILAAHGVGRLWEDEATGHSENFLAASIGRMHLLGGRIALLAASMLATCLAASLVCGAIAHLQHIPASFATILVGNLNYLGPAYMALGVGALIYSVLPRVAAITLYAWVGWSFVIEMLGSAIHINQFLYATSLLHHITMAPAVSPDWLVTGVTAAIGLACFALALPLFARRDLVSA